MMLALPGDVVADLGDMAGADRECGVAALPLERLARYQLMRDEVCRSALRLAYQFGQGERRREASQQMDVVLDAADGNDLRAKFHHFRPDRTVDSWLDLFGQ